MSFLDCVKHFKGEVYINEFKGFIGMNEVIEYFEKEENEYSGKLKWYINNYDRIIMNKKSEKEKVKKLGAKNQFLYSFQ